MDQPTGEPFKSSERYLEYVSTDRGLPGTGAAALTDRFKVVDRELY